MLFENKKAFKATFLSFYTPLCNYANNTLNNIAGAEDIVQDVFLHLWEFNDAIELPDAIDKFLFKSVKNKTLEYIRSRNTYEKHKLESMEFKLKSDTIEDITETYLKLERLNNSLRHLPPKCKNVFVLQKFKGLTYAEIAEVENISVKTVENHMLKALKILRTHLK